MSEGGFNPEQLFQALTQMQTTGVEFQRDFESLSSDDKAWAVFARLLIVLSGDDNPVWLASAELKGLNFSPDHALYVSNYMNCLRYLAGMMTVGKQDVDLVELENSLGATKPEDEVALRYLRIPLEWQWEPGDEIIKTEIHLWDALAEILDVNTMRDFARFTEGDVEVIKRVLEEYYPADYPNRDREINNYVEQFSRGEISETEIIDGVEYPAVYTLGGDKISAKDFGFEAIVMRRILRKALGLRPDQEFPGLPHWTSLLTAKKFPVEDLSHYPVSDPKKTQMSYLWNALGPVLGAAEAIAGVFGDAHILRQDVSPWLEMQSNRAFITPEDYENDQYDTMAYLATGAVDMALIYDAFLHRAAWDGVKKAAVDARLRNVRTNNEVARLSNDEIGLIERIITVEMPFDPFAYDLMVSQKRINEMDGFIRGVRKLLPREPGGDVEKRARPFGTWGRAARAYLDNPSNRNDFLPRSQGGKGLFEGKDFSPWMERVGIRGDLLEQIRSRSADRGGCMGPEGLVTLLECGGMRVMDFPETVRSFRNWFHYAKSVDATIKNGVKLAFEIAFETTVPGEEISKKMHMLTGGAVDNYVSVLLSLERDVANQISRSLAKMADPNNTAAFRFKEAPEMVSSVIQRALLVMLSANLSFPVDERGLAELMDGEGMEKLRQSIPSAGYLVAVDWDDFVASGGKQMRPARITRRDLQKIASNLGENPNIREAALLDMGYYWMPKKSKVKVRDGEKVFVPEDTLHHPSRRPVRQLVPVAEFRRNLGRAVGRLEQKSREQFTMRGQPVPAEITNRINNYRSLLVQERFSPVHLKGLYAAPELVWKAALPAFEGTGSGTPFVVKGDLDVVRSVIDLYVSAGLMGKRFTEFREIDLREAGVDPTKLKARREKIVNAMKAKVLIDRYIVSLAGVLPQFVDLRS